MIRIYTTPTQSPYAQHFINAGDVNLLYNLTYQTIWKFPASCLLILIHPTVQVTALLWLLHITTWRMRMWPSIRQGSFQFLKCSCSLGNFCCEHRRASGVLAINPRVVKNGLVGSHLSLPVVFTLPVEGGSRRDKRSKYLCSYHYESSTEPRYVGICHDLNQFNQAIKQSFIFISNTYVDMQKQLATNWMSSEAVV